MHINLKDGKITVDGHRYPEAVSCSISDLLQAIDGSTGECLTVLVEGVKVALEDGEYLKHVNVSQQSVEQLHAVLLDRLKVRNSERVKLKTKGEMIEILAADLNEWPKSLLLPTTRYYGWHWFTNYRGVICLRGSVPATFAKSFPTGVIHEDEWKLAKPKPTKATLSQFITRRIAMAVDTNLLAETEIIIEQAIKEWNYL